MFSMCPIIIANEGIINKYFSLNLPAYQPIIVWGIIAANSNVEPVIKAFISVPASPVVNPAFLPSKTPAKTIIIMFIATVAPGIMGFGTVYFMFPRIMYITTKMKVIPKSAFFDGFLNFVSL